MGDGGESNRGESYQRALENWREKLTHHTSVERVDGSYLASCSCGWDAVVEVVSVRLGGRDTARQKAYSLASNHWWDQGNGVGKDSIRKIRREAIIPISSRYKGQHGAKPAGLKSQFNW